VAVRAFALVNLYQHRNRLARKGVVSLDARNGLKKPNNQPQPTLSDRKLLQNQRTTCSRAVTIKSRTCAEIP